MNIDPHTYAETFIAEGSVKSAARARGEENGVSDVSQGTGAYLRQLAPPKIHVPLYPICANLESFVNTHFP